MEILTAAEVDAKLEEQMNEMKVIWKLVMHRIKSVLEILPPTFQNSFNIITNQVSMPNFDKILYINKGHTRYDVFNEIAAKMAQFYYAVF